MLNLDNKSEIEIQSYQQPPEEKYYIPMEEEVLLESNFIGEKGELIQNSKTVVGILSSRT